MKKVAKEYDAYNVAHKGETYKVSKETLEDIFKLPYLAIEARGITAKTAKHFGIRTALDEKTQEPIAHYFPYTSKGEVTGFKKRDLTLNKSDKGHFTSVGKTGVEHDLFGTLAGNATGGKKVWITEGEYDAAICWQVLKENASSYNPTVLSIATGTASAAKNIGQKHNMKYLRKFSEIILAFDADSATPQEKSKGIKKGREATDDVYGLIPDIKVAPFLDGLDPCEMFDEQGQDQLYWALMKPIQYTPEGFIKYSDVREKALEMPKLGRPWPWDSLTKKTLGRRLGEGIYIGSGVKMGKCFQKGTKIRMADGSVRNVEDIKNGDSVMGLDSLPRKVSNTHKGVDNLYEVKQTYGRNYTVNSQHLLVLKDSGNKGNIVIRPCEDLYKAYGDCNYLRDLKGFHVGVDYPVQPVPICAYTLGVWLGDGSRNDNRVTLNLEDSGYILPMCKEDISKFNSSKAGTYEGCILKWKSYFTGFNGIKKIPDNYLLNSREIRLKVLAGWIDTDGYKHASNSYEILTKDYSLAVSGQSLVRSLGLKVCVRSVEKGITATGFKGTYYRLIISGDLTSCPIQVPRKQCLTLPTKDSTRTGVKIWHKGQGEYFGFEVDKDHMFLLEDYTVVHNSEFANKVIEHITTTEKDSNGNPQKVAVFKFEEQPDETLKKIAGKFFKRDFVNPERVVFIGEDGTEIDVWGNPISNRSLFFTQEELEEAIDSIGENLILYNNYGRCHWAELKGAIRHAVLVEDVKDIFIDPITRLTAGMTPSEANTELETFADEISKMSQDLGFTYYCFCHLKAPTPPAKPHEMGGKIYSSQFRGSRAMMQACHYMLGLEGNKSDEIPTKQRNTREIVILDDRKYGRVGRIKLFYDEETGDFLEPPLGFLDSEEIQTLSEWYACNPDSNF